MKAKQASRIDELPARMRRRRVLAVRRQIRQGRYDTGSRLAVILDRILEALATWGDRSRVVSLRKSQERKRRGAEPQAM